MRTWSITKIGFNLVAPIYEFLLTLVFFKSVRRMEKSLVSHLSLSRNILIPGEGNGRFLNYLARKVNFQRCDVVEISKRMIEISRTYCKNLTQQQRDKIQYFETDIYQFQSKNKYDTLITNYFLDLFSPEDLVKLVNHLDSFLEPGGLWYVTDFYDGSGPGLPRFIRKLIMIPVYFFFVITTGISGRRLMNPVPLLLEKNYILTHEIYHVSGLIVCRILKKSEHTSSVSKSAVENQLD